MGSKFEDLFSLPNPCSAPPQLLKWTLDVARGMKYLHGITYFDVKTSTKVKGILHRDLKPDNCLVTDTFGIRIADFGEARMLDADDEQAMTQVGTPIYIAPEIVKGDVYSCEAYVQPLPYPNHASFKR